MRINIALYLLKFSMPVSCVSTSLRNKEKGYVNLLKDLIHVTHQLYVVQSCNLNVMIFHLFLL